jgi:small ligand-binding sensory domain FIST
MKFAAALTTKVQWLDAVKALRHQLQPSNMSAADVAFVFVHTRYVAELHELAPALREALGARHFLGCTGGGIIGADKEIEHQPAISVLCGQLPGVTITPFAATQHELEESTGPGFWHYQFDVSPAQNPNLVLLADPLSIQAIQLVEALSEAYPGTPLVGGLASGGQQPGNNRLLLDDQILDEGCIGVALTGNIALRTIVSQGCKPIGDPLTVTRADKNIIFELGGRPPMVALQEIFPTLSQNDQQLARTALFLGRVVNEYQENFSRGDFLIRNLIGRDPNSGALAVGDWMRTGQTVQFQVRDGKTADEDLRHLLARESQRPENFTPRGALLFSCLGRGEGMYGAPNHDIQTLHHYLGPVATAGFFCNGEIGPIGDKPFVHGFTSSIGLFIEAETKR